eukprot:XP_027326165.1 uncharacterized protein LOC101800394 isoform X1 [Anas platyrhynchos]
MALTTVYTDLELPPGPRGIPQLPKPPGPVAGHRWYWVIMGTGWVGAAVLAGIVVWLLQRHVSDGNSLNPTGSCSWESCLGKDTPSSNCSLNYFQLGLRERLCEAESHQAPGSPCCYGGVGLLWAPPRRKWGPTARESPPGLPILLLSLRVVTFILPLSMHPSLYLQPLLLSLQPQLSPQFS